MDTLTIVQKLKKKKPELADDPLMAELEAGLTEGDAMAEEPMNPKTNPTGTSYLDAIGAEEGEADADMLMAGLDVEEGLDTPADELMEESSEGGEGASYLDAVGAEEDELLEGEIPEDEEEIPAPAPKRKRERVFGKMSRA